MKNFMPSALSRGQSSEKGRNVNSIAYLSSELVQTASNFAGIRVTNLFFVGTFLESQVPSMI